ncbi:MAG TPA: insulinase family protein [Puia sp.]|jgi:zinc protease|nr:insulinase family protein [Puia sp.]
MRIKFLILAGLVPAMFYAADAQPLPLDPAVRMGHLANGFTYFIRHNEEPKNRVVMYLVNKAGSVLEDEDQRGLAHFMEHMNFNGTAHFPHNELVDYLQKAGVRFGADINAYTSFDETVYQLPIPSDDPQLLIGGIAIMRDWAHEALLDPIEIDKERGVVLEEKRLGKGAAERMQRQYWPVLLNGSRYAVRIPIGIDTVLDNFKRPAIARFYHDWYRPDLQALIIVGDINVDSLEKVVRARFSDLKNPAPERPRTKYRVALSGRNSFVAVTDKEMPATVAEVIIKHKKPPLKSAADYKTGIITDLFNQMLDYRYAALSRQADPPFVQGGASISDFIGGLDNYDVNVVAKPGELERGFKAVWRETERVRRFGFTPAELERAKAAYLSGMEDALKEKDKTNSTSYVKEYQAYFLDSVASPGISVEYRLTRTELPAINLTDVNDLGREYIADVNRDILVMAPEKDKRILPDEAAVDNWLKEVANEKLLPYKDSVSTRSLLSSEPVPGQIRSEQQDTALNLTTLTLSNGVKVVLKPTEFKNEAIVFGGFACGGTSLYNDSDFESAANAAELIAANGVGNYDPGELDKYLEGKQLNVRPYINERFEGIRGRSTRKDLEAALQLVYAEFTEPRKDTAISRGMIEQIKSSLQNRGIDPNSVFRDTVNAVLGDYNSRKTGPTIEKMNQVNLDKAYAIYKERFADASNFTFTFVGSFDLQAIRPLLEKYLGGLPANNRHEESRDLNIHAPEGRIVKKVYKGSEPKSMVVLVFSGKFEYSPYNSIKIDALKEALQIRLLQRLREEESGVYNPAVYDNTFKYPQPRYSFTIQFGCSPENVDKLIASTLEEIGKLKATGPLPENVDKWRAEEKRVTETQLKTNGFWLNYLTDQLQNKDDLIEINNYNALLDRVTSEELKQMADLCLSGNNYIQVVLLPESKR